MGGDLGLGGVLRRVRTNRDDIFSSTAISLVAALPVPPPRWVRRCREVRQDGPVPEMPEVEGLAQFLRERAVGRAVSAVEVGAVSALKTFSPRPPRWPGGG